MDKANLSNLLQYHRKYANVNFRCLSQRLMTDARFYRSQAEKLEAKNKLLGEELESLRQPTKPRSIHLPVSKNNKPTTYSISTNNRFEVLQSQNKEEDCHIMLKTVVGNRRKRKTQTKKIDKKKRIHGLHSLHSLGHILLLFIYKTEFYIPVVFMFRMVSSTTDRWPPTTALSQVMTRRLHQWLAHNLTSMEHKHERLRHIKYALFIWPGRVSSVSVDLSVALCTAVSSFP